MDPGLWEIHYRIVMVEDVSHFMWVNLLGYAIKTFRESFLFYFCLQWTTDADLADAIHELGITDLLEVKFHENRVNGQSKG